MDRLVADPQEAPGLVDPTGGMTFVHVPDPGRALLAVVGSGQDTLVSEKHIPVMLATTFTAHACGEEGF